MSSVNYLDKAGTTWLVGKIKTLLAGKVDKVSGKGLSTNDFTTAYKTKLDNAAKMSDLPTSLSDLTDDATHRVVTDTQISSWNSKQVALVFNTAYNESTNKAATMTDIADAIKDFTGIDFQIVDVLPATGKKGVIYLVSNGSSTSKNVYDEYIWLSTSNTFEKIGTTDIDLSNYVQYTDLVSITNDEIDAMFQ